MNAAQLFDTHFAAISTFIEFNTKWNNGTGYLDGAVEGEHALTLPPGTVAKSTTLGANNRDVIFVGTSLGTVAVFQRFTGRSDVLVCNAPRSIRQMVLCQTSGALTEVALEYLLGHPWEVDFEERNNIGMKLNTIKSIFMEADLLKKTQTPISNLPIVVDFTAPYC